jgi:hypothetical protein
VPAEGAVECHGKQRTTASDHQIVRHGWAGVSRHSSSGRARCRPGIFARWPAIEVGGLHTTGGRPLVNATASVGVSGRHGVLAVRESSGPLPACQMRHRTGTFHHAFAPRRRRHLGPPRHQPNVHCGARQGALRVSRLMAYHGTTARWPGSSHRIRPAPGRRDVTAQINYSAQLS